MLFFLDMLIEFFASQQFKIFKNFLTWLKLVEAHKSNSGKAATGAEKVPAEEYSVEIFKPIARASFLMLRKDS